MRIKMIKLANSGPMIIGKEVHKADREINLVNPMIVYQEKDEQDSAKFKIGTFLEVADQQSEFKFYDYEIECLPSQILADTYTNFVNDTIKKTE